MEKIKIFFKNNWKVIALCAVFSFVVNIFCVGCGDDRRSFDRKKPMVPGKYSITLTKMTSTCEKEFQEHTVENIFFLIYPRDDHFILEYTNDEEEDLGSLIGISYDSYIFTDQIIVIYMCEYTTDYLFDFNYWNDELYGTYEYSLNTECLDGITPPEITECVVEWNVNGELLKRFKR